MVSSTLHIAMFPWFATGHITPYVKLSNKLAEKGHRVSFFLPTKTQNKFHRLNLYPHLFQFISLTIKVDGLPVGAETMSDVPLDQIPPIQKAFDLTQDQVAIALRNLKPDCIFYDFAYWVPTVAKPLGIKCIHYAVVSAVSYVGLVPAIMQPGSGLEVTEPPETYPGSSSIKPLPFELKDQSYALTEFDAGISLIYRVFTSMRDSEALCFRACSEMEGTFLDYLEKEYKKPVLLIGPILTEPSHSPLEERWAKWLGGFEKGSVIYCAFGSECVLEKDQFRELVLGLELTGLPFLVRLKPPAGVDTVEEALPEGFEERVRGRGVVHGGWVQQQLILAHPSVGCYVGHCGFGSMWESLGSTCQLVLVPHFADQFVNTKFMTNGLKVAVDVERRAGDGWFTKEDVCKAVKLVMDEGSEVGEAVRANHHEWYQFLTSEGLESSYINNLVIKLQDLLK